MGEKMSGICARHPQYLKKGPLLEPQVQHPVLALSRQAFLMPSLDTRTFLVSHLQKGMSSMNLPANIPTRTLNNLLFLLCPDMPFYEFQCISHGGARIN